MPKITLLPGRVVKGWKGENLDENTAIQEWPIVDASVGLLHRYNSDAHFVCYHIQDEDRIPRLNIEAISILKSHGIEIQFTLAVLDIDNKPHRDAPTKRWREEQEQKLDYSGWGDRIALYHTKGGYRILCRLDRPYNVTEFTQFLTLWRKACYINGIVPDEMGWNGLYRLPFTRRDGVRQEHPSRDLENIAQLEPISLTFLQEYLQNTKIKLDSNDKIKSNDSNDNGEPDKVNIALDTIASTKGPFVLPKVIKEGYRVTTLFKYASHLRARGLGEDNILKMLLSADMERCTSPLQKEKKGRAELELIAFRVSSKYETGSTYETRITKPKKCKSKKHSKDKDNYEAEIDDGIYRSKAEPNTSNTSNTDTDKDTAAPALSSQLRRSREDPMFDEESEKLYAEWIIREIADYGKDIMFCLNKLRKYKQEDGLWYEIPSGEVRKLIATLDGAIAYKGTNKDGKPRLKRINISTHLTTGVEKMVHTILQRPSDEMNAIPGMSFRNGFVKITKKGVKLIPFARKQRAISKIDCEFTFDPKTPLFDEFLDEILIGSDAEEKKKFIWEFIGCSLAGLSTAMQKALICIGEGANGKSVLMDIWKGLIPEGRCTSIPPQKMGEEYSLAHMSTSLLNAVNETPNTTIAHSEGVKAVISGDVVMARYIRQAVFEYRPVAAQVFNCNDLPKFSDLSGGFARRWIILNFLRIFDEREQYHDLANTILNEEKGNIICKALLAVINTLNRGNYAEPTSSETLKMAWRTDNDHVMMFIEERCVVVKDNVTTNGTIIKRLYQAYRMWATINGYEPITSAALTSRLKRMRHGQKKSGDQRYWELGLKMEE